MENNEKIEQETVNPEQETMEDVIEEEEGPKQKTYDVAGLLIGAVVGILAAIIGLTDVLMGIIAGMFFGLVIGTFIKKK